jgi:hypothetical protein
MAHETVVISGTGDTARLRRILEEHGYTVRQSADAEPRSPADTTVELADSDADEWTWRDEDEAYKRKLPELMKEYEGRYVAMFHGQVVGVGDSARAAAREGIEHLGRPEALTVAKVGEPIPEPVRTGLWIDTPRHVVVDE